MSKYRTCAGCLFEGKPCAERDKMRTRVAGLGITSMKWKCDWRRAAFKPGDPVRVRLITFSDNDDYGNYSYDTADYPGTFVQSLRGSTRLLVFILPGVIGEWADDAFEPKADGAGFCKIPRAYVSPTSGVPEHACPGCGNPSRLLGHADYCRFHPQRAELDRELYR